MAYTSPVTGVGVGGLAQNPLCAGVTYGWYTRTGGPTSDPKAGIRRLIIIWNGSPVYNTTSPQYTDNDYIVIGQYAYKAGQFRSPSPYGWHVNDSSCGTASPPSGDHCNSFDVIRYSIANPTINSFTINKQSIIQGQSATLSWTSSDASSAYIDGIGPVPTSGTYNVTPSSSTTYTLTVSEGGVSDVKSVSIIVYVPPTFNISVQNSSISVGGSTTVSWFVSGDGDAVYWTSGGLTNNLVTSSSTVSPIETTTYCGYATGQGGTSTTSCVTVIVNQPPSITLFNAPSTIEYGEQGVVELEYYYATSSATLSLYYDYEDGNGFQLQESLSLGTATSAELSAPLSNRRVTESITTAITYNDFGPRKLSWQLSLVGAGGTAFQEIFTTILIDETPTNLNLVETDEKFATQEPVFTPDIAADQVVESDLYNIDDIDIPVEIKSNYPIKVDLNLNDNWQDVRQI